MISWVWSYCLWSVWKMEALQISGDPHGWHWRTLFALHTDCEVAKKLKERDREISPTGMLRISTQPPGMWRSPAPLAWWWNGWESYLPENSEWPPAVPAWRNQSDVTGPWNLLTLCLIPAQLAWDWLLNFWPVKRTRANWGIYTAAYSSRVLPCIGRATGLNWARSRRLIRPWFLYIYIYWTSSKWSWSWL